MHGLQIGQTMRDTDHMVKETVFDFSAWQSSAVNEDVIDTVLQQKMTANIWEMAGEEVEWDKLQMKRQQLRLEYVLSPSVDDLTFEI